MFIDIQPDQLCRHEFIAPDGRRCAMAHLTKLESDGVLSKQQRATVIERIQKRVGGWVMTWNAQTELEIIASVLNQEIRVVKSEHL